jgi:PBP1b-binding outer membrane lipoprotein LpoB
MKKIALILVVVFITALVISSCNKEACPAYSQADTEQSEQVG